MFEFDGPRLRAGRLAAALQAQAEEADRADRFGAWANRIVALIAVALSALVEVASAGRWNRPDR